MRERTLVIILNQDRDLEFTLPSIKKHVLQPLNADLAFCGSWTKGKSDSIKSHFTFDWSGIEPTDWVVALDQNAKGDWRKLIQFGEQYGSHFLGPTVDGASTGSGLIGHYWRYQLKKNLTQNFIDDYEWFVITRSDWLWKISHPDVTLLNEDKIYVLAGESYGGVNDRHIIVSRRYIHKVLMIPDFIFLNSLETVKILKESNLENLNCERFYKVCLNQLDLLDFTTEIPYLGFLIRQKDSTTRWASGKYNWKLGVYVKYQTEYELFQKSSRYIKNQNFWSDYLSNPENSGIFQGEILRKNNNLLRIIIDVIKYKNVRRRVFRIVFGEPYKNFLTKFQNWRE